MEKFRVKNCLWCNKKNKRINQKYCCKKCSDYFRYYKKSKEFIEKKRICKLCEKEFITLRFNKFFCKPRHAKIYNKFLNKQKIKDQAKLYQLKNKEKVNQYQKDYQKYMKKFKAKENIKNCINCNRKFISSNNNLVCKINCKCFVIYRISIDNFSYIGISINLNKRIKTHLTFIKKYIENLYNLEPKSFYRKIAFYIVKNKKSLKDLKFEILEYVNKNIENITAKEKLEKLIFYIEKYNSIFSGFNCLNYFYKKLKYDLKKNIEIENILFLFKKYKFWYEKQCDHKNINFDLSHMKFLKNKETQKNQLKKFKELESLIKNKLGIKNEKQLKNLLSKK